MEIYCQLSIPDIDSRNKRVSINFVVIQDCYRKPFLSSVVKKFYLKNALKLMLCSSPS